MVFNGGSDDFEGFKTELSCIDTLAKHLFFRFMGISLRIPTLILIKLATRHVP